MNTNNKNNIIWHNHLVNKILRENHHRHTSIVLWFTGLSGSGKSTIAGHLEKILYKNNISTYLLDGDNIRHGLCSDLDFTEIDRKENIRRVGEVAKLMIDAGLVVLTALISPYQKDRNIVRNIIGDKNFLEIFVDTPLDVCKKRDSKHLYKKNKLGLLANFTGIDAMYEIPRKPDIYIDGTLSIESIVKSMIEELKNKNIFSF
ncbi:MAG TPA: adenylyl-sulfate kinase [Buchnera sp. (in: enterobacteria)]|nr:adenylyl-sulfate kinase [Buchnera sp. (in: enterobacteria)]